MSYMLLTSMEFKDGLTGFSDEREDDDQTFFTREQWEKIISDHNGEIVYDFPPKGSKIDVSGQTVYVTRFANDYEDINKGAIKDFLRKRISEYMIPSDIVILPEIPLSENKKVDTKDSSRCPIRRPEATRSDPHSARQGSAHQDSPLSLLF